MSVGFALVCCLVVVDADRQISGWANFSQVRSALNDLNLAPSFVDQRVSSQGNGVLKVLALGDSLTFGCGDTCTTYCTFNRPCFDCVEQPLAGEPCSICSPGYRARLWQQLEDHPANRKTYSSARMIGPLLNGEFTLPNHANSHAGYPGVRIKGKRQGNRASGLDEYIKRDDGLGWGRFARMADVILVHVGSCDILQNNYKTPRKAKRDLVPKLKWLMRTIRSLAPTAQVFLASIIQIAPHSDFNQQCHAQAAAFNAAIPAIATQYGAHFVDMANELPGVCAVEEKADKCCQAGWHPSRHGYKDMADVWFKAMGAAGLHQTFKPTPAPTPASPWVTHACANRGGCSTKRKWDGARRLCSSSGMNLCSVEQVNADLCADTCGGKNDFVWTRSRCGAGKYWTVITDGGGGKWCRHNQQRFNIRCCFQHRRRKRTHNGKEDGMLV